MLKNTREDSTFATVLSDGKIHINVPEGTEGAKVRKYKTSDGTEGSKTELVYNELIGIITKVDFYEGEYGMNLQVEVTDGEEKPVVLSLATSSSYGEDMMKKLPNVDLSKRVKIVPFAFIDDKKKNKKGVTIWQHVKDGEKAEKITNYFYDAEKKENVNGYPNPKKTKKPFTKDQWKLYFGECREFLIEKLTDIFKIEAKGPVDNNDF